MKGRPCQSSSTYYLAWINIIVVVSLFSAMGRVNDINIDTKLHKEILSASDSRPTLLKVALVLS